MREKKKNIDKAEKEKGEKPEIIAEPVGKNGEAIAKEIENEIKTDISEGGEEKKAEVRESRAERWKSRAEERDAEEKREHLASWVPKTKIGKLVKEGKVKDIDYMLDNNIKIAEPEIVDLLINTKTELLNIGQSKGKFGGGKRRAWRQTQRKTKEGNRPTFSCLIAIGDGKGHIGIGHGKSNETLPARNKAIRSAKLNITKIKRGCGSFDCSCRGEHSIPFRVEGKMGSTRVMLMPAPQGTGLVIGDECKKILRLAGIMDAYSKTFGQVRTTINFAGACIEALKKTNKTIKITK